MSKDGPLNNNSFFRGVSNKLDSALGQDSKNESRGRAAVHGAYHALQCDITGNQRECERAKDKMDIIFGGPQDHLVKYDAFVGPRK